MINWDRDYIKNTYPDNYRLDEYGMCVGNGWIALINRMTDRLIEIINVYNEDNNTEYKLIIRQIKEKFGGLRYYYSVDGLEWGTEFSNRIRELVSYYESAAYFICEVCGAYGDRYSDNGWLRTVCEGHRNGKE